MNAREYILLADDNATVTSALSVLLERPGRTTIVCSDVESAEIMLSRSPVTHLVTDVQFSGAFGYEGLHFLGRVHSRLPLCRIVLITGQPSDALRTTAMQHGANALLSKPFDIDELEAVLESESDASDGGYEVVQVPSLDDILARGALDMAFQPIVQMTDRGARFIAFEALARVRGDWPAGGPAQLFEYAERLGRLRELNLMALTRAIESAAGLPETASVFINLDPSAFGADLPGILDEASARSGVSLSRIVLEITERSAFTDPNAVVPLFSRLHERGIRFALDDHGSAYSHLSIIDQLRPSFVKISNTFGTKLEEDETHRLIVAHVASMARDFGCMTILEGIESPATAMAAAGLGIDYAQGYHFGRPQAAAHWSGSEETHA
jgi:EAL domain-containing protein (putative c-di-GMP-specific phosphodiesterase class I)/ActR/RegA family two-component response regulator